MVARRRGRIVVAGLDGVGDAVAVAVLVAEVRRPVAVAIVEALVGVGDPVAVAVGVEVVGDAVFVRVDDGEALVELDPLRVDDGKSKRHQSLPDGRCSEVLTTQHLWAWRRANNGCRAHGLSWS